jgi:hypothetical protein
MSYASSSLLESKRSHLSDITDVHDVTDTSDDVVSNGLAGHVDTETSDTCEVMDTKEEVASTACPNTVIFFDWDDTLLASSFVAGLGYKLDTDWDKVKEQAEAAGPHAVADLNNVFKQLQELEVSIAHVINTAMSFGTVHIVTNAETGWVQLSAQKFLPGLVPLVNKLSVISARSTYEPQYADQPIKWKYCAFESKVKAQWSDWSSATSSPTSSSSSPVSSDRPIRNVISFGDSHVEREAVRALSRGAVQTRTKSVKFAERSTAEQLRRQHELVSNCFSYLHSHAADLDLQLTVTPTSPAAPPATAPAPATTVPQAQSAPTAATSSTSGVANGSSSPSTPPAYGSRPASCSTSAYTHVAMPPAVHVC